MVFYIKTNSYGDFLLYNKYAIFKTYGLSYSKTLLLYSFFYFTTENITFVDEKKCKMKYLKYSTLLIPLIFTVLAVNRYGFLCRAAVSLSCAVILWFMSGHTANHSIRWVMAALIVSIAGDWFMSHSGGVPVRFIYGVAFFFVAHVGFLCFCLKNGRINRYLLAFVLAGYLTFFFIALLPALLSHAAILVAVLLYLLISCFSLAAAAGLRLSCATRWIFTFGIALLVFSDTLIALKDFAGYPPFSFLILPTYFLSHIFITMALIRK